MSFFSSSTSSTSGPSWRPRSPVRRRPAAAARSLRRPPVRAGAGAPSCCLNRSWSFLVGPFRLAGRRGGRAHFMATVISSSTSWPGVSVIVFLPRFHSLPTSRLATPSCDPRPNHEPNPARRPEPSRHSQPWQRAPQPLRLSHQLPTRPQPAPSPHRSRYKISSNN